MIEIIKPRIVDCLGLDTFNALRKASGLKKVGNIAIAIESSFSYLNSQVVCQAHTRQLGKNNSNRGGVDRVTGDWTRLAV